MIHYHGTIISNVADATKILLGGHAFVSFIDTSQLNVVVNVCQSFAIDNGAFSAWKSGKNVTDWNPYYAWADDCMHIPSCDFAVIPDVIDGDEDANDALINSCPLPSHFGVPVWHMHESLTRLKNLMTSFPRICLGSSGEVSTVGSTEWWKRMSEAMTVLCDSKGRPKVKLHGLRMLNVNVFNRLPLASADSTNIAMSVAFINKRALQLPRDVYGSLMRTRIEGQQSAIVWDAHWADTTLQKTGFNF